MRVEDSEVGWPESLAQVTQVGDRCVCETFADGKLLKRADRATTLLGHDGGEGACSAHQEEGNLFDQQTPGFLCRPSLQWPPIQQHEDTRERHEHRFGHQAQREAAQAQCVPQRRIAALRSRHGACETMVTNQCQQEAERAQHILALRNPGHGFHVQRVDREDGCGPRAQPVLSSQSAEQREHQHRVSDVPEEVHYVENDRVRAEQLHVEHQRYPSERMPVARVEGRERPAEALRSQAGQHMRIGGHVFRVVVVDEARIR